MFNKKISFFILAAAAFLCASPRVDATKKESFAEKARKAQEQAAGQPANGSGPAQAAATTSHHTNTVVVPVNQNTITGAKAAAAISAAGKKAEELGGKTLAGGKALVNGAGKVATAAADGAKKAAGIVGATAAAGATVAFFKMIESKGIHAACTTFCNRVNCRVSSFKAVCVDKCPLATVTHCKAVGN